MKASRIVGCTLLHQVLVSAIAAAIPVAMPELVREAGLFEGLAGLYALSMYAGAVAATLCSERVFRALGPARASALAVGLAACGLLLFVPLGVAGFVLGGLAIGLGYGPVSPAGSYMMAGIVGRKDLNLVFSIRLAGAPLGVLAAGLCVPPLVAALGWRGALAALACALAVPAMATLGFARRLDATLPVVAPPTGGVLGAAREVFAHGALRWLVATSFLFSAMLATLKPRQCQRRLHRRIRSLQPQCRFVPTLRGPELQQRSRRKPDVPIRMTKILQRQLHTRIIRRLIRILQPMPQRTQLR